MAEAAVSDRAPDWVADGTPEPLRSGLVGALGAEDRVLTRALELIAYASDASPYRRIPRAVVMPRSLEEVSGLLRFAGRTGISLTFRAGGTSLNGQAQSDSVLVDVRRHWQSIRVLDDGHAVRVGPGTVLGRVNRVLARHGRKLGPDPASTDIACVGGVIANNSGGMRCGVVADPYSTVRSMTLVLADGSVVDTARADAGERFRRVAPALADGLISIRDEIRADTELSARIRQKFEIKNTTGYRLCAFLDAEEPLEIFRRLVVGSEGTLAFVAEAVLDTVALGRRAALSLALFESVDAAAEVVPALVAAGATATELMVAPTLIAAAFNMAGTPERWKTLPSESAALLVEFRSDSARELDGLEQQGLAVLADCPLVDPVSFTRAPQEIGMLWRVREGMQGLLAAMRAPGVSMIIEDVCVPPARIAEAVKDLQALLGEHGFLTGVAGHASAGNLHFLLTLDFGQRSDRERYDAFMHALVELIVEKYDGSLKAEHGTGVNMAPYVEREWGARATEMMWRVKELADPGGVLNPGVVLNRSAVVHLEHLHSTPEIEEVATKCIECGFCEPACPSRNVTTTPRQRIVLRREMARQPAGSRVLAALREQYEYDAVQTCAADGSCSLACPVGIDTGELVKQLRGNAQTPRSERLGALAARRFAALETAARLGLRAGGRPLRLAARRLGRSLPAPATGSLPATAERGAAAVYLPACINRIFAERAGANLPAALVALSERAGVPVWIPPDVAGVCCGTPWASKGFKRGLDEMAARTGRALGRWSDGGRLPVVIDATSCAQGLAAAAPEGVEVIDSIAWVHDRVLPSLPAVSRRLGTVAVHPTCASQHLGLSAKLSGIAAAMAEEVLVPAASGCCGMAGDRGWLHPELPASALRDVAAELSGRGGCDAYVTSNRTCEVALQQVTGRPYRSFVLVLEELTRPA